MARRNGSRRAAQGRRSAVERAIEKLVSGSRQQILAQSHEDRRVELPAAAEGSDVGGRIHIEQQMAFGKARAGMKIHRAIDGFRPDVDAAQQRLRADCDVAGREGNGGAAAGYFHIPVQGEGGKASCGKAPCGKAPRAPEYLRGLPDVRRSSRRRHRRAQ